MFVESRTNQVFPIFPNAVVERLQQDYGFHVWEKFDAENSVIRLVGPPGPPRRRCFRVSNYSESLCRMSALETY
jgi:hypothetical protein